MEYGLLFRKTSTCYKHPDIEYLDENSDYRLRIKAKDLGISVEELQKKNDVIAKDISYLTKENHGRVYAGGFLRDGLLSKKGLAPEKWDNEVRKKAITAEVFKVSRKYGTYRGALGHKMVFSVSNDLAEKIENSELKLDDLLGREVKKIMYEFQNKFHPGEKIGFAWGIHHDTKHRHVHIYLCNRTDKGKHVALSNPLKGRRDKRFRKNQIGYIKERCVAAQERMLAQAEKVNKRYRPKKHSDLKIEHKKPDTIPENLIEKEANLERMRQAVVSKENQVKIQQESIRQFYSEYYLRKDLVAQGWNNVKSINQHIQEKYQDLKKNDTVVSNHLLRQLGRISDCGYVKHFSKLLFALQNAAEKSKRDAIFQQINQSREYKTRLMNQLKLLDWQQKVFQEHVKKMKQEREKLKKEFYLLRSKYDYHSLRFNFDFFKSVVNDRGKREEYYQTSKRLWEKRKSHQDSSEELALLRKLDLEAREIEIKKETQISPEQKNIDLKELEANHNFFKLTVSSRSKRVDYLLAIKKLKRKLSHGENFSEELNIIKSLDKEAQEIVKNKPKIRLDDYLPKTNEDDNNQSRGMKF